MIHVNDGTMKAEGKLIDLLKDYIIVTFGLYIQLKKGANFSPSGAKGFLISIAKKAMEIANSSNTLSWNSIAIDEELIRKFQDKDS